MALFRGEYGFPESINGIPIPAPEGSISGGGGGGITGLTPGVMPIADTDSSVVNGPIDDGVTSTGLLSVVVPADDVEGILVTASLLTLGLVDAAVYLYSGQGMGITNQPTYNDGTSINLDNFDTGGILLEDSGGGGILLESPSGEIVLDSVNNTTNCSDFSVSTTGQVEFINTGAEGTAIADYGGGGITIFNTGSADSGIEISNSDTGGTTILDLGGGGISFQDASSCVLSLGPGGLVLVSGNGQVYIQGVIISNILYSAAGQPLPDPTTVSGASSFVSDATANVYATAYVSGGSIIAPVYSDGVQWNMG